MLQGILYHNFTTVCNIIFTVDRKLRYQSFIIEYIVYEQPFVATSKFSGLSSTTNLKPKGKIIPLPAQGEI